MASSGATTNARGEVAYPAPGAFPTDDLTPSATPDTASILGAHTYNDRQHEQNKLRKRDDPRGWDTDAAQQQQTSSHGPQYTDLDNGIGGGVPKYTDTTAPPPPVVSALAARNKAQEHGGNSSKPGVMTGAYSRLPLPGNSLGRGHGNGHTTGGNATSARSPTTTEQLNNPDNRNHAVTGGLAAGTATATGAVAHPPTTTSHQAARGQSSFQELQSQQGELEENERNLVRNGRDHSSLAHKDPYWGDVPYGTGVYNTVSGHGSTEPTHVKIVGSTYDNGQGKEQAHGAAQGLNQSQVSRGEEARIPTAASKPSTATIGGQQRAFPLTGDHSEGGLGNQTGYENQDQKRDSRFSEGLVGAGVGAGAAVGAGYVASELTGKEKEKSHSDEHQKRETTNKNDNVEVKKGTHGLGAGLLHRDHKDKDDKEAKQENKHPEGLAYYESQGNDIGGKEKSPGFTKDHSKDAAAGGAALAAATAAYGAHEHTKREGQETYQSKTQESSPISIAYDDTESKGTNEPEKKESKLHALFHRSHNKDKEHNHVQGSKDNEKVAHTKAGGAANKGQHTYYPDQTVGDDKSKKDKQDPFAVAQGYHPSSTSEPAEQTKKRASVYVPRNEYAAGNDSANDNKLGYGAAGAAAGAGVGAGYLAHKHAGAGDGNNVNHNQRSGLDNNINTNTGTAGTVPQTDRVPLANTSHLHSHPVNSTSTPSTTTDRTTSTSGGQHSPTTTSTGSAAHYKVLSSGTPSGIDVGGKERPPSNSTSDSVSPLSSPTTAGHGETHRGYRYAAAGAAAGAGVGAAGYGATARNRGDQDISRGTTVEGHGLAGAKGREKVVTHQCRKCGEENDISEYFRGQ
ncbi:hypothetical protein F5X99DRAFT_90027 [Biscogniauxia marginata]|nr:hypothetical protein F5X99DRAFT_90027 [Biscogniauxia marginata]